MIYGQPEIYKHSDDICFRICSVSDTPDARAKGDCTDYRTESRNWTTYYACNADGVHLHCATHPNIELSYGDDSLHCIKCKTPKNTGGYNLLELRQQCLMQLNAIKFKDAKLIRVDDYYIKEIRKKEDIKSDYWIESSVKTDKDGDTMIMLLIGNKNSNDKAQYFIKPEKLQLTSDHKDLDPAKIISKIEVTLKDRVLVQKYDLDNQPQR